MVNGRVFVQDGKFSRGDSTERHNRAAKQIDRFLASTRRKSGTARQEEKEGNIMQSSRSLAMVALVILLAEEKRRPVPGPVTVPPITRHVGRV